MIESFLLRIDGIVETLEFETMEDREDFINDFHAAIVRGLGDNPESAHVPIMTLYNTFKRP